jgi:hypothetical protein
MALYFCAMYGLGGAFGPPVTGTLSAHFTERAAIEAGVDLDNLEGSARYAALEPYRGRGINDAMYALPAVGLALTVALFLGASTVRRDVDRLHRWMSETAESEAANNQGPTT